MHQRIRTGLDYAFTDLLKDIGSWLLLGIGIAALIATLVPDDLLGRYLGSGWLSMLLMLVVGIPLYICASASTPVAAALVLKGLSPGAALVFLLAGPATNAATITIVLRYWGRRSAAVYLASIAFCALSLGWLVDQFYSLWQIDISHWVHPAGSDQVGLLGTLSAVVLILLLLRSVLHSPTQCDCPDS